MLDASRGAKRLRDATQAALTADLTDQLTSVSIPVGLLWGSEDPLMPAGTTDAIRACRPEAPVEVIPGAAHVAQLDQPERFARSVERLLARSVTVS